MGRDEPAQCGVQRFLTDVLSKRVHDQWSLSVNQIRVVRDVEERNLRMLRAAAAVQVLDACVPEKPAHHVHPVKLLDDHDRAVLSENFADRRRSEEHTSELQSQSNLVCRLLLEKKNK